MKRFGLGFGGEDEKGDEAVRVVVSLVEWDRREGKGRFGLGLVERGGEGGEKGEKGAEEDVQDATENVGTETDRIINLVLHSTNSPTTSSFNTPLSTTSIPRPSKLQIRATQGHSLAITDTESLLTEITLEKNNIPDTVVHGTFYGAWNKILRSGGLKSMGRGFVHCASGPRLVDVLPHSEMGQAGAGNGNGDGGARGSTEVDKSLVENKVRSGMRSDAQILIYVDIRRSLESGVKWWRSENGVLLTEGIEVDVNDGANTGDKGEGAFGGSSEKILPLEFFDVVVEIKKGAGVLWRYGKSVKELPEELERMGVPRGKDRDNGAKGARGGGRGRGGSRGKGR